MIKASSQLCCTVFYTFFHPSVFSSTLHLSLSLCLSLFRSLAFTLSGSGLLTSMLSLSLLADTHSQTQTCIKNMSTHKHTHTHTHSVTSTYIQRQVHLHAFICCLFLCLINYWHLLQTYMCSWRAVATPGEVTHRPMRLHKPHRIPGVGSTRPVIYGKKWKNAKKDK